MAVVAQALTGNKNPSDLFEEYLGHPIQPLQKIMLDILATWSFRKWTGQVPPKEGLAGTIEQGWRQRELEYKARQAREAQRYGSDRHRDRRRIESRHRSD